MGAYLKKKNSLLINPNDLGKKPASAAEHHSSRAAEQHSSIAEEQEAVTAAHRGRTVTGRGSRVCVGLGITPSPSLACLYAFYGWGVDVVDLVDQPILCSPTA